MGEGDCLAYEGTVNTMRNVGGEPLVLLVSAMLDPEQPGFIFEQALADPTATRPIDEEGRAVAIN